MHAANCILHLDHVAGISFVTFELELEMMDAFLHTL